jgi:putative ABC transport system substrate-binding protein
MIFWTLRIITLAFGVTSLFQSEAQSAAKVPRIGFLSLGPGKGSPRLDGFRRGLSELGYIEGKNVIIEFRFAQGNPDIIRDLAIDLVRKKVDVIVTAGTLSVRAAQQATTTIPIVFAYSGDPVKTELVASLARPGGNATGLSLISDELSGKRLELLKEVVPKMSRVGVLWDALIPDNALDFETTQVAGRALGVKVQSLEVRAPVNLQPALSRAVTQRVHALLVIAGGTINAHRKTITEFAVRYRLPAMYETLESPKAGGLMAYGVNVPELFRRSAAYVDKILKGAKPADLPVQRPMRAELVINLKTAESIGINIPPEVLQRADTLIR